MIYRIIIHKNNIVNTKSEFYLKKMNILDIIKRIKYLKGFDNELQVAEALGISSTSLSNYKKRSAIPYGPIITFCIRENINVKWIFTGMKENSSKKSNVEDYAPKKMNIDTDDILDFTDYRSKLQKKDHQNQKEKVVWTEAFGFLSYILQTGGIDEIEFIHYSLQNMVRLIKKRNTGE